MTTVLGPDKLDATYVKNVILANRKHFSTYNIIRLRELIRCLPANKLELFYTIPLLLHVNCPDCPGYVDDARTPHGIHGFYDSGFWKLAKKRLGVEMKDIRAFVSKKFHIKGLYLMGSSGTPGQTSQTCFDYWAVIDKKVTGNDQRALLKEKMKKIERWSEKIYGYHLTFFVLDVDAIQANDFSGIDEQGFRPGLGGVVKEEFYWNLIMIAGQIPYWAVLPVGLKDAEYMAWIKTAKSARGDRFFSDDYIDLGNLTIIGEAEYCAALLWQLYKARYDPIEAFIKASLIAQHYFYSGGEELLCDIAKRKFPESRMDSYLLDSHTLVFDRVLKLYENLDDHGGIDLIRQCIYLRLIGYPVPEGPGNDTPRRQLLRRYIAQWPWPDRRTRWFESYASWPEKEKLAFENKVIGKLWYLYSLIFRAVEQGQGRNADACGNLAALKNKAASRLKTGKGKLPYASVYLRSKLIKHALRVTYIQGADGKTLWAACDKSGQGPCESSAMLFSGSTLLCVLGWIVYNGLHQSPTYSVDFQPHIRSPIPCRRARKLLRELSIFFSEKTSPQGFRDNEPKWCKVFVALDGARLASNARLQSADYLVQNTWGEMYFLPTDLTHIHNNLLKHHAISKKIWQYLKDTDPDHATYHVFDLRTVEDPASAKEIGALMSDVRKGPVERDRADAARSGVDQSDGKPQKEAILLDLF